MIVPSKIKSGDEVILIAPSRKVDLPALEFTEALLKKWKLLRKKITFFSYSFAFFKSFKIKT